MSRYDNEHIKNALRMQRASNRLAKLRALISKPAGAERVVGTSRGGVRVLEYGFGPPGAAPLFVGLHGGGFVLGSADMDEPMNLFFVKSTKARVIDIDYPLAPQSPYPSAIEAVYETIKHYAVNAGAYGVDPMRIGIGGHSAGANLAAVICMMAKARGDLTFRFQVLDCPPLDLMTDPHIRETPIGSIPPKMADIFKKCYLGDDIKAARSPYASPVFASKQQLIGLPPALIIVAGRDSLQTDGMRYRKLLKDAGVHVEFHDFEGSVHGFTYMKTGDAREARSIMAGFMIKHFL